jgi:hypothetical protein
MRSSTLLRAALAAALSAAPAAAQPFLPVNTLDGLGLPSIVNVGQTITPPAATPLLTGFTFHLGEAYNGANLRLGASVFEFAGGGVVGPALLGIGPVAGSGNALSLDQYDFDFPGLLLDPTRTYVLLLTATGVADADPNGARNLVGTMQDPLTGLGDVYAGGTLVLGDDAAALVDVGFDAAFDARFAAVPEPATVALVAGGLVAMAGIARRRARG